MLRSFIMLNINMNIILCLCFIGTGIRSFGDSLRFPLSFGKRQRRPDYGDPTTTKTETTTTTTIKTTINPSNIFKQSTFSTDRIETSDPLKNISPSYASTSCPYSSSLPQAVLTRTVQSIDKKNVQDRERIKDNTDVTPERIEMPNSRELVLLFLGCEAKPSYGPYEHTARLFLDLISRAVQEEMGRSYEEKHAETTKGNSDGDDDDDDDDGDGRSVKIILKVYGVSQGHFPPAEEYDNCHGVIIPGSTNSAYDNEPWIERLMDEVIQNELVANGRPTLGVCFGHQVYAHSFYDKRVKSSSGTSLVDGNVTDALSQNGQQLGRVVKFPAGFQVGRRRSHLTEEGRRFLIQNEILATTTDNGENENNNENISKAHQETDAIADLLFSDDKTKGLQLYYSHGDMVESLPPQAIAFTTSDRVPVQAAIYFSASENDSLKGSSSSSSPRADGVDDAARKNDDFDDKNMQVYDKDRVIAITLQAHPEFGSSLETGVENTLNAIMQSLEGRDVISSQERHESEEDAKQEYETVNQQSIETMITIGRLLRWEGFSF